MEEIERLFSMARESLLTKDDKTFARTRSLLLGQATHALLGQDKEPLLLFASRVGTLAVLADQASLPAKPGDALRLLADLLSSTAMTPKPMERLRLANPRRKPGQMLRRIYAQPGVTPSGLSVAMDMKLNHVSNVLRTLLEGQMVYRISNGRRLFLYVSEEGEEALEFFEKSTEPQAVPSRPPCRDGAFAPGDATASPPPFSQPAAPSMNGRHGSVPQPVVSTRLNVEWVSLPGEKQIESCVAA